MQVLSAFRGILSGTMEKYFEELSGFDFPGQQAALEKKLHRGRILLSQSVDFLNSRKDNQLMELYSRKIVDMATEILIGYLFLKQSLNSSRKLKIARMFINNLEPVLKMRASHIKNADKTCLKNYSLIVDPAK